MDATPAMAAKSWGTTQETASGALSEIGTTAADTYNTMADQAENAWERMSNAASSAVSSTIAQLRQLKAAASSVGTVTVGTSGVRSASVPGHARGTDNFEGGLTRINEEGGELAILPGGSQIIPADQTDNIINASRHSKSITFAPQITIQMSGNTTEEEMQDLKARLKQMLIEVIQETQDEDSGIEAIQVSLS